MSRLLLRWIPILLALGLLPTASAQVSGVPPGPGGLDVVATGIPRPAQVVVNGHTLVVLGPGLRGDAAGELYDIDLSRLPIEFQMLASRRLAFGTGQPATLGSVALHSATGQLFLAEENGTRVYRLEPSGSLTRYATGLHRVPAGGALAFDAQGRLLILDYVDRTLAPGEDSGTRDLEALRGGRLPGSAPVQAHARPDRGAASAPRSGDPPVS